jgi:hypothetical protein
MHAFFLSYIAKSSRLTLWVKRIKDLAELQFANYRQKCRNRFENDQDVMLVRGMLWNLTDFKSYIE